MKVGIVVIVFNLDARVFILQMESIKRFCKDEEFTIEVVDNSTNEELSDAIKHHARVQNVNYRRAVSGTEDPSFSHSFAANFAFSKVMDKYEALLFLDHDAIPVKDFSVEEMLGGKMVTGLLSGHDLSYFWPGCLAMNMNIEKKLVNFYPNNQLRLDTGGELRHLKNKYGDEGCRYIDEVGHQNPYRINDTQYYFYMMLYNNTFLHFIGASNWMKLPDNEKRISELIAIATEKISQSDL